MQAIVQKLKGLASHKYFFPAVIALAAGAYFYSNRKPKGSGVNNPGAGTTGGSGTNNPGAGSTTGGSGGGNTVVTSEPGTVIRDQPYVDNVPEHGSWLDGWANPNTNTIAGKVPQNTVLGTQLGLVADEGDGPFSFRKVSISNWEELGLDEAVEDGNIYYVRDDVSYLN